MTPPPLAGNVNRGLNKMEKVLSKSAKHLLGCPKELPCGTAWMQFNFKLRALSEDRKLQFGA